MDGWLKQSTAISLRIGPFLDSTDGNTAETGLTISQADVRLSKAGGDFAQKTEATSCTHDELGYYICPLDATDTATLGMLKLAVHESGALAVWHTFMVVPANVFDSLFGSDKLQVHADEITAGLITAAAIADAAIDFATFAADCKTGTGLKANVESISANAIAAAAINTGAITNAKFAAGAIDAAAIADAAIDIATFAADVKTGSYLNAQTKAQDNIDFGALQKASLNSATPASVTGAVGSVTGAVGSVTAGVTVTTNNDKTGYGLSAAAVQAVWDALLTALTTAGSIGKKLADWVVGTIDTYTGNTKQTGDAFVRLGAPVGASVSADIAAIEAQTDDIGVAGAGLTAVPWNAAWDAEVQSECADALNTYDPPTKAELDTAQGAVTVVALGANVITAASLNADAGTEIAAAVWAKTGAVTSLAVELLLERLYEMVNNKMIVTEATGAVALRNLADSADVATGNVQDLGATTQRNALTWV